MVPASSAHRWTFHRLGGLDQVAINSGADLLALTQLDPKLWVALSCPVKGLELDERTLALIDRDKDGRIRVPDILETIRWAEKHLRDVGELLQENDALPLAAIRDDTPEGSATLAAAKAFLGSQGGTDAGSINLAVVQEATQLFAARPLNADGVVRVDSTDSPELQRLIQDIIACLGGVNDRNGSPGVDAATAKAFITAARDYLDWTKPGLSPRVLTLGEGTGAAAAAVAAVRSKVDDYFARVRLASFDPKATDAMNAGAASYTEIAARELTEGAAEISALPLAQVAPGRTLPLFDGVNPAWAGALATLHAKAVAPVFGESRRELTESQWQDLKARVAPYESWQAAKKGAPVEPLGRVRLEEILASDLHDQLLHLIAQDQAAEPDLKAVDTLERLTRLRRDFATLLRNFVNFTDFYSPDRLAIFQAGVLYLDSRSTELCVDVADSAAHSKLANLSHTYLAYCELKRAGSPPRQIAACFTQGDSDYLRVGRNGLFYDRQGRDWDATVTLIVDNPISIRQAFWSPYKKVARFVEEQMAKFAAAKEKATDDSLAAGVTSTAAVPAAPGTARPAFDVAKFAGIFAAIGLALGAIGGAIASVATGFMNLSWWQMPLAILGALLLISGPSMLLAALKLRRRTLGPILDGNGWAINGRVHINIPFGTKLTERATLPPGATRSLDDPYADDSGRSRRRVFIVLLLLLAAALVTARVMNTWPFAPAAPESQAPAAPTSG